MTEQETKRFVVDFASAMTKVVETYSKKGLSMDKMRDLIKAFPCEEVEVEIEPETPLPGDGPSEDIFSLSLKDLKKLAAKRKIKGRSKFSKARLQKVLMN